MGQFYESLRSNFLPYFGTRLAFFKSALDFNAGNSVIPWLDFSAGHTLLRFKDTVAGSRAGLVLAQKMTVHVLMVRPTYL